MTLAPEERKETPSFTLLWKGFEGCVNGRFEREAN